MLIALCLVAGFTALLGMSSVALALVPAAGVGLTGIGAAAFFGLVSLATGLTAAFMAMNQDRRVRV